MANISPLSTSLMKNRIRCARGPFHIHRFRYINTPSPFDEILLFLSSFIIVFFLSLSHSHLFFPLSFSSSFSLSLILTSLSYLNLSLLLSFLSRFPLLSLFLLFSTFSPISPSFFPLSFSSVFLFHHPFPSSPN